MDRQPNTHVRNVLVLLSGGQDSTTCLFWAKRQYPEAAVHALTIFYGQRHQAEIGAASEIALKAGCHTHDVVDLSPVFDGADSQLMDASAGLITVDGGLADEKAPGGLPTSFVPGRNLAFLATAATRAAMYRCAAIVTGVCQTDYSGYPDCRSEFVAAMERAINLAMPTELRPVVIDAPLMNLTKAETVLLATSLPGCMDALARTVTCYLGQRPGCATCPACVLRAKGFEEAGIDDPSTPDVDESTIREAVRSVFTEQRARSAESLLAEQVVISAHGEPTPQNEAVMAMATILYPLAGNPANRGDYEVKIGENTVSVGLVGGGYAYNLADDKDRLPAGSLPLDNLAEMVEAAGVASFSKEPHSTGDAGLDKAIDDLAALAAKQREADLVRMVNERKDDGDDAARKNADERLTAAENKPYVRNPDIARQIDELPERTRELMESGQLRMGRPEWDD